MAKEALPGTPQWLNIANIYKILILNDILSSSERKDDFFGEWWPKIARGNDTGWSMQDSGNRMHDPGLPQFYLIILVTY
jgi:hypothetical protein